MSAGAIAAVIDPYTKVGATSLAFALQQQQHHRNHRAVEFYRTMATAAAPPQIITERTHHPPGSKHRSSTDVFTVISTVSGPVGLIAAQCDANDASVAAWHGTTSARVQRLGMCFKAPRP